MSTVTCTVSGMARRSYGQYCTLAEALDVVGERWTLLIVRELMLGPRRFTDLAANLPGMGRNLLSERLRHLEDEGLVRRRTLDPPAASRVYELSEDGRSLGPVLAELGRWGVRRLGEPRPGQAFRAAWAMFPLSYMASRDAAEGVRETYEFRVDDEVFQIAVDDGAIVPRSGSADSADVTISLSTESLLDLLAGTIEPLEAISSGRVVIEGEPEAVGNCLAIVGGVASG
jgi:DNA-binding HxlR family transcriptional regulator